MMLADLGRRKGRRKRRSWGGHPGRPPPQSDRRPRTAGGTFHTPPLPSPAGSTTGETALFLELRHTYSACCLRDNFQILKWKSQRMEIHRLGFRFSIDF
jgi:hypothetical protein